MADNHEVPQNNLTPESKASEKKEPGKRKDFWIGFGGSIGGNILMFGVIYGLGIGADYVLRLINTTLDINLQISGIYSFILMGLPWVANIVAITLLLIFKRHRIVLGILGSYAITLLLGLGFAGYCFFNVVNS